ncbi:hypothetical protein ACA910_010066 [Epithemia clementina (nom. ined.)]
MYVQVSMLKGWNDQMLETLVQNLTSPINIADILAQDLRNAFQQLSFAKQGQVHSKQQHQADTSDQPARDDTTPLQYTRRLKVMPTIEQNTQQIDSSWVAQTISRMATFSLRNYNVSTTATKVPEHP